MSSFRISSFGINLWLVCKNHPYFRVKKGPARGGTPVLGFDFAHYPNASECGRFFQPALPFLLGCGVLPA